MNTNAILCVDDEAIILMSLKMMLRNHYGSRFQYEGAIDAESALKIIESLIGDGIQIILIVSDWLMPGIKGDEFLKIVHDRYPEIKAIMVSGQVAESRIRELEEAEILTGFLSKPVVPDQFYTMIDTIISPMPA